MNDFVQMDIFFFITSLVGVVALFFVTIIGIYLILIVQKIKLVIKEFELFAKYATKAGQESVDAIKKTIDHTLNDGGIVERIIASALGTILAKTFARRGKIRKDAPKKKD